MIYLVAGLDRNTFGPWQVTVQAGDVAEARKRALARAHARRIDLVVVSVFEPNSKVMPAPAGKRARWPRWPQPA